MFRFVYCGYTPGYLGPFVWDGIGGFGFEFGYFLAGFGFGGRAGTGGITTPASWGGLGIGGPKTDSRQMSTFTIAGVETQLCRAPRLLPSPHAPARAIPTRAGMEMSTNGRAMAGGSAAILLPPNRFNPVVTCCAKGNRDRWPIARKGVWGRRLSIRVDPLAALRRE